MYEKTPYIYIMKNIYQMLLRSFAPKRGASYTKFSDITPTVLAALASELSLSHIWFTGVIRHATAGEEGVKGLCGSPYAISDYHDVNPYLGSMQDFEALVRRSHRAGLKVIIDFVPNHVARAYSGSEFDEGNFYPGRGYDYDWSDTAKLNYESRATWDKMLEILLFWASKGVDGFRCDMIELVRTDFWHWALARVKKEHPGIVFIGEAYQPEKYAELYDWGGFDYLYDKSGMYDSLKDIERGWRRADDLTRCWQSLREADRSKMLRFLENHDEDRYMSWGHPLQGGAEGEAPQFQSSVLCSTLMWKSPFMLYFGQEFGHSAKTSIFDPDKVDAMSRWVKGLRGDDVEKYLADNEMAYYAQYKSLLKMSAQDDVFVLGETFDLVYANYGNVGFNPERHFAWLRGHNGRVVLCVASFEDCAANLNVRIPEHASRYFGVRLPEEVSLHTEPFSGTYRELL